MRSLEWVLGAAMLATSADMRFSITQGTRPGSTASTSSAGTSAPQSLRALALGIERACQAFKTAINTPIACPAINPAPTAKQTQNIFIARYASAGSIGIFTISARFSMDGPGAIPALVGQGELFPDKHC